MAKPLKVWNGTEWVEIAAQLVDTDIFLMISTASATYLPISATATLGGGGFSKSFLLGGI